MTRTLRRHDTIKDDRYIVLTNSGNAFLMPKFSHLMMDNGLIEIDIPDDYYSINREALDSMTINTNKFILNLIER